MKKEEKDKAFNLIHVTGKVVIQISAIIVSVKKNIDRTSGGSRKFWCGGMIKILSTKPQKFGCVVTRRVAINSHWSSWFRGLGAKPPALKNFACFCKNNLILKLV